MNILITGGTGFIGRNLIKELRLSHNIFLLLHKSICKEYVDLPTVNIDDGIERLSSFMSENKIDGIVHLASLYLSNHKSAQIKGLIDSNVYLGTAVLEAATSVNVKWFLNVGTIWQNYKVIEDEYNPVNLYAATKQAFVDVAQYYVDAYGIKFCTLKLCDTYGPCDTRNKIINLFKTNSEKGDLLKMSPGNQKLDLLYISDVVSGFVHLIDMLSSCECIAKEYVLSSGRLLTLREIASIFENVTSLKLNIEWGGLPYREREVMMPWQGNVLPQWQPLVNLEKGILNIMK